MVKIIINLNENYIEQKADVNNVAESLGHENPLGAIADVMSFMSLKKKVEEGKTEFSLSRELLDDKGKELFDRTVSYMAALSSMSSINEEKDEE